MIRKQISEIECDLGVNGQGQIFFKYVLQLKSLTPLSSGVFIYNTKIVYGVKKVSIHQYCICNKGQCQVYSNPVYGFKSELFSPRAFIFDTMIAYGVFITTK